jgi:hypothetical protein
MYEEEPVKQMTASEALFGFCGWLTSREKKTIMSSTDDAGNIAELISEFCKVNNLDEPRDNWTDLLTHPKL